MLLKCNLSNHNYNNLQLRIFQIEIYTISIISSEIFVVEDCLKVWHFDNTTQYHTISGGSGTISVSDGEFKGGCAFLDETFDNNSSWILECDAIFLGGSTGIGLTEPNTVRRQNLRMLKINQSGAFGYSNNSNTWVTVQNLGEFDKLSLFVTSYSVNGNLGNHTEAIFFIICIFGNIINVVMEEGIFRGLFQNLFERRYSFWPSAIFASLLFGLWHCVGPIRSFTDGDSNRMQLIMNLLILIGSSTLIGLKYAMLSKITGSLYAGMADHFVNNTIINILHVVSISEIDQLQIIRISIAQTVSFIIVFIVYYSKTINGCKK